MEGVVPEGMAVLDEAMLEVITGGVSAPVAGTVYCSLIEACEQIADLRRAQEWTDALSRWCDSQRGMVTFTGQCLVHRATIKQLHGEGVEALQEVRLACTRFAVAANTFASGAAMYRLGELHRLRGDDSDADEAYSRAAERGYDPQPGLALLRLGQRRTEAAAAAIRRAVDECHDRLTRVKLLPALVEIARANGEKESARAASDELAETAASPNMA
jgi:TPR repeat protein